jgi:hypothetical protein
VTLNLSPTPPPSGRGKKTSQLLPPSLLGEEGKGDEVKMLERKYEFRILKE